MTTSYAANNTRPHWAGAAADLDIHIEAYEGDIDQSFAAESIFRTSGLTNFKSVQDYSNTWRGDRLGGVTVRGRRSGEALTEQRIVNEKLLVTVDTTSYIRTTIDEQDDWTAPDFSAEKSQEHGTAHAKAFDQAHIIQLIKAGSWVAPASLKASGAFNDGITGTLTGWNASGITASEQADIIVQEHKSQLATFVRRDLGGSLGEFVTLMDPTFFNTLLDHDKLMNVEFSSAATGGNDFAMRRVAVLNGIRVIETPRFPQAAITDHHLGPGFNVTAAEARSGIITFHPRHTLVTVEAKPMTVRPWHDPKEMNNVLDSFTMYTVGIRRGDAVGVLRTPA